MSQVQGTTPAGWYDDGTGHQRWWDGQQWGLYAPAPVINVTPARPPINGAAITGFIFGLIAVVMFWAPIFGIITSVVGLAFSAVGLSHVQSGQRRTGKGLATTGLVLSCVGAVLFFVAIMFAATQTGTA